MVDEKIMNEIERLLFTSFLNPKSLRIFISFKKEEDGGIAAEIKKTLENYGLEVFVAHDDIAPSKDWQNEIVQQLKSCDVFIPLLTNSFPQSPWTDQEVGIAIAHEKHIIPAKIDIDPYGFMAKYQALRFNKDDMDSSCSDIIDAICLNLFLKDKVMDCVICYLSKVDTFNGSGKIIKLLSKHDDKFSKEQINEIVRASNYNGQVHYCFVAKPILEGWLERYKDSIHPELARRLLEKLGRS